MLHSELLRQNTGLTVPILDALSNLNLRPDLLAEVSHVFDNYCKRIDFQQTLLWLRNKAQNVLITADWHALSMHERFICTAK